VVTIQLGGACEHCPAAEHTLHQRLIGELRRRMPGDHDSPHGTPRLAEQRLERGCTIALLHVILPDRHERKRRGAFVDPDAAGRRDLAIARHFDTTRGKQVARTEKKQDGDFPARERGVGQTTGSPRPRPGPGAAALTPYLEAPVNRAAPPPPSARTARPRPAARFLRQPGRRLPEAEIYGARSDCMCASRKRAVRHPTVNIRAHLHRHHMALVAPSNVVPPPHLNRPMRERAERDTSLLRNFLYAVRSCAIGDGKGYDCAFQRVGGWRAVLACLARDSAQGHVGELD